MAQGSRQIQSQAQQQVQTLSPQQILVVKLLELPAVELEDRIHAELLENPALEEGKEENVADEYSDGDTSGEGMENDANEYDSLSDYLTEDDIPDYKLQENNRSKDEQAEDIPFSDSTSFYEILKEQLRERNLTEHQHELVEYLIGSLDDDGLLRKSLESICDELAIYAGIESTEEELEEALILSDVGASTAAKIVAEVEKRAKLRKTTTADELRDLLREVLTDNMLDNQPLNTDGKPAVILVIGVNGVGKTTSIGKLAARYVNEGKKVMLSAADTFRAAAADQLEIWAKRAGADIVRHGEGADPAAVVFDSISAAKARGSDIIIVDTAGRLHNKANLMNELAKIDRVISRELPDASRETLLVLDATTGQNAVHQAEEFNKAAELTGIILTKLDGTAKGGIAVAIMDELKLPVLYIGVGEGIEDLQAFDANAFVDAIF